MLNQDNLNPSFKIAFSAQLSLLNTINMEIKEKISEVQLTTTNRYKRGLINGLGSFWKLLTGNLDASDGEYYNDCINRLEKDDSQIQLLMKNQIHIISSTIRNFNNTLRNLEIDEITFNENIKLIQKEMEANRQTKYYYELQIKILNMIEQIMQSNTIILDYLNDIINSITFARLAILHPSVIDPKLLLQELNKIPSHLKHGNLPFSPTHDNLSKFINLIKLEAFQTNERIVFILHIPIMEFSEYELYHTFSLPTKDKKTDLFHVILPMFKYTAIARDSKQYVTTNLNDCKLFDQEQLIICFNLFPKPLNENAPCEVTILVESRIKEDCDKLITNINDYNIQKLLNNKWLIIVSNKLPVTTICPNKNSETQIIEENSLLTLPSKCNAFIGATRIFASDEENETISTHLYIPDIQYDCCEDLPRKEDLPKLKPMKINHLNLDELNVAQSKLDQFDKNLDNMLNEPFATRHWSTITYILIVSVSLIIIYILLKCCRRKCTSNLHKRYSSDDGHDLGACCPQIFNYCNVRSNISRRPSLHLTTTYEANSEEVTLNAPVSNSRKLPKKL